MYECCEGSDTFTYCMREAYKIANATIHEKENITENSLEWKVKKLTLSFLKLFEANFIFIKRGIFFN